MAAKARVYIDARMVGETLHGIARYVSLLAHGLSQIRAELDYEPVFLVQPGRFLAGFHGFEATELAAPFLSPRELLTIPMALREGGAALYHSPSFSSLVHCPCPWVVTVHDLNHLKWGGFAEKLYYTLLLKPFARRARTLLAVSEFSRGELAAWLGVNPVTIGVVRNAVDPLLSAPVPEAEVAAALGRHGLKRGEYFFCLSNPKPHKNVATLARAYAAFREHADADAPPLVLSMREHGEGKGVRAIGPVPEPEVRPLLAGARAVFFPSHYEGFGLPPLEAAIVGAPVVVSRIAPHQEALAEVGEGRLRWVEPNDVAGWVDAMKLAWKAVPSAVSLEERRRLAIPFEPARLGREMNAVYRRCLGI